MSDSLPVVLLVAREGVLHKMLSVLLGDECALLGARTAVAALQLARQRPPDVVLLDDSFDELETLVSDLRKVVAGLRVIVLANPTRPGTDVRRLAALGPVVAKPYDHTRFRELVLDTARLSTLAATDVDTEPSRPSRFNTTQVPGNRKQAPPN
jgi:DNA-binding response OmpR family regulator